ncbi:MAG: hypothetical protein HDT43_03805 [Ruminococcaceae bacterium]|nr:hypothetical protein [Oscillospiraceae bacterium]
MVHSLRKYISNRGSALFMVISTMTALMIAVMAMYFSVISARTTQFATFFQKQSYQSAISLNDMVLAGLMDGSLTTGDSNLFSALQKLGEGETITTGANGFTSFDSTETGADVAQMGAYSMDITRLPNEMVNGVDNMTFDIATTTINNGVADTVHTYFHISMAGGELPEDNNIFAATGYVDNDANIGGGYFITDVFFDSQTSYISLPGGAGDCVISGNLKAGGNVVVNENFQIMGPGVSAGGIDFSQFKNPVRWEINGDLTCAIGKGILKFPKGTRIVIGGDYDFRGGGMEGSNGDIDVYICGNLNLNGNTMQATNVNLHVGGDITYGQINNAKKVYVAGSDNRPYNPGNNGKPDMSKFKEIKEQLKEDVQTRAYAKWIINDGDESKGLDKTKSDYLPELDYSTNTLPDTERKYTPITIKLNDYNQPMNGVPAMTTTFTIAHPDSPSASMGAYDVKCYAGDIISVEGGYGGNLAPLTVILDTGDSEDDVLTLRVHGYMDQNGNNGGNIFQWFRTSCTSCTVLVKGKGSLVIDIPEDTIYQDCDRQQFVHQSWLALFSTNAAGETVSAEGNEKTFHVYDGTSWVDKVVTVYDSSALHAQSSALKIAEYIHTSCVHGDGCSYSQYTSTEVCKKHEEGPVQKVGIKCTVHGKTSFTEICPKCHPDGENADRQRKQFNSLKDGTYEVGVCEYRLEKNKLQSSGITFPRNILPNVNVYLISCYESADIRLGNNLSGGALHHNGLFGMIYAPYMTFKARGSSGGANKLCGGLIVSDFSFDDTRFVTNLYPDKMPWELMGESSGEELVGLASKSWKIGMGSY